jgi:hypothetical protein
MKITLSWVVVSTGEEGVEIIFVCAKFKTELLIDLLTRKKCELILDAYNSLI